MNIHFSGRDASKAPIYIHRMYMVYLLSDNSIIENRLKDRKTNVNGRKCLKLVENKCTYCAMGLSLHQIAITESFHVQLRFRS